MSSALVVDDGTAAVTDNYLKLSLDRPQVRNEWIEVRVTSDTRAVAIGNRAGVTESGVTANGAS